MTTLPFATALVAGLVHALEADHMAAVTTFVSRRPHPVRALGFGVRWGVGHSGALLVAGGVVVMLQLRIPEAIVRGLEAGVGAMLVLLGMFTIANLRAPELAAGLLHRPRLAGSAWVGAAHGVAGTAGFLAIIPAVMMASPWSAGGYLIVFGIGTVVAMGAYALMAGILFNRAESLSPSLPRLLRLVAGLASVTIGAAWILGAMR